MSTFTTLLTKVLKVDNLENFTVTVGCNAFQTLTTRSKNDNSLLMTIRPLLSDINIWQLTPRVPRHQPVKARISRRRHRLRLARQA